MNNLNDTEIEVELASAGQRIGAYIINNVIWLVLMMVMVFVWSALVYKPTEADIVKLGMWVIAVSIIYLVIQAIFMSRDGQTIGKKIMGVKVIDADGETAGFVRFFLLREAVYNIILTILGVPLGVALNSEQVAQIPSIIALLICFVMLFVAADRRTLQDKLANTYVIQLPKKKSSVSFKVK